MSPANQKRLDRIAAVILAATAFLGLFAFVPGGAMAGDTLKGYLLIAGSGLSFVFWLIARLVEGTFRIPLSKLLAALGIFAGTQLVSAVFSHTPYLSFFGQSFDQGAAFSVVALALMSFLASVLISSKKRVVYFVSGFFLSYAAIALFQFAHLFFPTALSFGIFSARASTPVGIWTDFAYLSGAAVVGFVLFLSFFKPSKQVKIFLWLASLLALFFIVLIGSRTVFLLVGVAAIITLTYKILFVRTAESARFPATAFVLALAMLFAFLTSGIFGGFLSTKLSATYTEARPNLSSTLVVARASLGEHALVGSGPNTFLREWIAHRPKEFNQSTYWNATFSAGTSFLMTTAFLGGIVGILAALLLCAAFVYESMRRVFRVSHEKEGNAVVFAAFIMAGYFLTTMLVATVSIGITMLSFTFLGLYIAVLTMEKRLIVKETSFLKDYRRGLWAILAIVVLLCISLTEFTFATKHFAAEVYFAKGGKDTAAGDFARADAQYAKAIGLDDIPKYEGARVMVSERYLNSLFSQNSTGSTLSDEVKANIQNAVAVGTASAQRSVALDPESIEGYLALGDFTRLLAPLKVANAFTVAETSYKKAVAIAPHYPLSYLGLAHLYFDVGRSNDARATVASALAEKPNYTEAFLLLRQIDAAAGDTAAELKDLQSAAHADTSDTVALLMLGEFQYAHGSYADAAKTLENVITASRNSVEAWYYLALADAKLGNKTDAARILTSLHSAYPDNADVTSALIGLSSNK